MTLKDVLEELERDKSDNIANHLLLANGFNVWMGVDTRYEKIFNIMASTDFFSPSAWGTYKASEKYKRHSECFKKECNSNLEEFRGIIELAEHEGECSKRGLPSLEDFDKDFKTAIIFIVRNSLSELYKDYRKTYFHRLLMPFAYYFTTNYDPTLYRLLLEIKDIINLSDGFMRRHKNQPLFYSNLNEQIFYYLHGAFHLVITERDREDSLFGGIVVGKDIIKIETGSYGLEQELLNAEEKGKCFYIFEKEQSKKQKKVAENPYLRKAHAKLGKIEGNLVIIGSSFADNDDHIYSRIRNNQHIKKIFVSVYRGDSEDNKKELENRVSEKLKGKKLCFFEVDSFEKDVGLLANSSNLEAQNEFIASAHTQEHVYDDALF